jgi:hypothetical protein
MNKIQPGTPVNPLDLTGGPDYSRVRAQHDIEVKVPLPVIVKGIKAIGRGIKRLFKPEKQEGNECL